MYIRFESTSRDDASRCNRGIFCVATDLRDRFPELADHWQTNEVWQVIYWFQNHLDAPDELDWRGGKRATVNGVCWFRPEAAQHVSQARYLSWLLNDLGLYVTERRVRDPGRVIWQDTHQVVASPYL